MILGFKQHFPWKEPTYFREKILAGAGYGPIVSMPKIHTMRADPTNRWKAGRKIEMVYRGAGYKIIDHFNKGIPELEKCVSVQPIKIWFNDKVTPKCRPCGIAINGNSYWEGFVMEGGVSCASPKEIEKINTLAINDGFKDAIEFFRWFNKDWEGKIIHFTNFRY